jgi:hypothetical protein
MNHKKIGQHGLLQTKKQILQLQHLLTHPKNHITSLPKRTNSNNRQYRLNVSKLVNYLNPILEEDVKYCVGLLSK